ncbi:MAG: hypothetical protein LKH74_03015 [Levilactobacillus sp.]|jgi:multisubunit Na+/H+ antiporter MnhE subunit|uniref:hypothetical protein n=1 Tax=Levilactobacillus sp. TaxID=2767919 RepID=UPI00258B4C3E|nr:hypothetical protein [Levilactobacillus sp.]MCI1552871.1 hypothetical protein [Levilactobacillus sp.]MCI1598011.1 hypothetical protein [Levilactobacillus sp.]MCI1605933.1 hypothetical protein [Levilactobacillus sp.]
MDEGSAPRLVVLGFLISMAVFAVFDSPMFSINQMFGVVGAVLLTGVFVYNLKIAISSSESDKL